MFLRITEEETESPPAGVRTRTDFSKHSTFSSTLWEQGWQEGNRKQSSENSQMISPGCGISPADQGWRMDIDGIYRRTYCADHGPATGVHRRHLQPLPTATGRMCPPARLQEEDAAAQRRQLAGQGDRAGLWSADVWLPHTGRGPHPAENPTACGEQGCSHAATPHEKWEKHPQPSVAAMWSQAMLAF